MASPSTDAPSPPPASTSVPNPNDGRNSVSNEGPPTAVRRRRSSPSTRPSDNGSTSPQRRSSTTRRQSREQMCVSLQPSGRSRPSCAAPNEWRAPFVRVLTSPADYSFACPSIGRAHAPGHRFKTQGLSRPFIARSPRCRFPPRCRSASPSCSSRRPGRHRPRAR